VNGNERTKKRGGNLALKGGLRGWVWGRGGIRRSTRRKEGLKMGRGVNKREDRSVFDRGEERRRQRLSTL